MSVHKRANNDTYYVSYRDAGGRQRTKTFAIAGQLCRCAPTVSSTAAHMPEAGFALPRHCCCCVSCCHMLLTA